MTNPLDPARSLFRITGADRVDFLQGLVSNNLTRLDAGVVYTAFLSPQGKYLVDFFLIKDGEGILLDVAEPLAAGLIQRLSMYKLRADVSIEASEIAVTRGLGDAPVGAVVDPRDPAMGWRCYDGSTPDHDVDWVAQRVAHGIPESGVELIPNDSYILEMDFERLSGVDFRKGCYVGQEVTARMHLKTILKKGLRRVQIDGSAPIGTEITSGGKPAGTLFSQSGGAALAYLRFDRIGPDMKAAEATLTPAD
ncbi:MAG: folate-binding protein YgfZ [Dinoroseobacter sp.]|jgi:folate-binding protein YgfZ